jgi:predicted RNA-binding protein
VVVGVKDCESFKLQLNVFDNVFVTCDVNENVKLNEHVTVADVVFVAVRLGEQVCVGDIVGGDADAETVFVLL